MTKENEFENDVTSQWCPGCPNFKILEALKSALAKLKKTEDSESSEQKNRWEIERIFREKLESKLKEKYKFKYIAENFDAALNDARIAKDAADEKRKTTQK